MMLVIVNLPRLDKRVAVVVVGMGTVQSLSSYSKRFLQQQHRNSRTNRRKKITVGMGTNQLSLYFLSSPGCRWESALFLKIEIDPVWDLLTPRLKAIENNTAKTGTRASCEDSHE